MKLIIALFFVIALLSAVVNAKKRTRGTGKVRPYPYKGKKTLCSAGEAVFFEKLKAALPDHHVFAQVQLSRLIDVTVREKSKAWLSRIDRKSADFVICDKQHQIVAAIELDDATHARKDRQMRDIFVEEVFQDAGVKLVRFHAREVVAIDVIRDRILVKPAPAVGAA